MITIKDKKVVIVGASSGIGETISKLCAENEAGAHLISLSEQKLVSIQNQIGGNTYIHPMDVRRKFSSGNL